MALPCCDRYRFSAVAGSPSHSGLLYTGSASTHRSKSALHVPSGTVSSTSREPVTSFTPSSRQTSTSGKSELKLAGTKMRSISARSSRSSNALSTRPP